MVCWIRPAFSYRGQTTGRRFYFSGLRPLAGSTRISLSPGTEILYRTCAATPRAQREGAHRREGALRWYSATRTGRKRMCIGGCTRQSGQDRGLIFLLRRGMSTFSRRQVTLRKKLSI